MGLLHISQAKPNTDDEIQRLEKELRLLELQQQVQEAKQKSQNKDNSTKSTKAQPQSQASDTQETKRSKNKSKEITQDKEPNDQTKQSLCGGKHSLSACFVGFEVGVVLGKADISGKIYHGTSSTPDEINHKGGIGGVGNLILGYQWYFIEKMGIGLKAHLGYGGIIPYFAYSEAGGSASSHMSADLFNAFNWGIQANYLLNFTKIFGLSLGVGFEMSHFDSGQINESFAGSTNGFNGSMQRAYPFDRFNVYGFIANVGLHFTSKNRHHQFGLGYTYKAYGDKMLKSSEPIIENKAGDGTPTTQTNFTATINTTNVVTLSYMYRF